ncbi:hypothetical protein FB451DRAFT_67158 [Mycena latifolia]|nr:hypothetical protein FB451DRAFT_67158 [Mycena latifolia]
MALLAPVRARLAEVTRGSGESVPAAHDTGPDLPPGPQIFYGRDTELLALVDTFSQRRQARTALLGQAGAGKSALALTLLHRPEIVSKFGARRYFVSCAAAENAADVFSCLAPALGLTHRPGEDAVLSALAPSPHDTLIVLDGLEQSPALNKFLAMLSAIPCVSLLLTLRGTQCPLGPMYTPFPVSLGPLSLPSARALFRDISDLPPVTDEDQDPLIDALLQRAGCLPQHVALLAQRAQYEPLPFLLARCAEEGGV